MISFISSQRTASSPTSRILQGLEYAFFVHGENFHHLGIISCWTSVVDRYVLLSVRMRSTASVHSLKYCLGQDM